MSKIHRYTPEEIEFLKEISFGKSNNEITKLFNKNFGLNLSEQSIESARKRYKIKNGIDGKFKSKHLPWNKGLKGYNAGVATRFKKGNIPHNYRPIGSERIDKDGYINIKVDNPNKWRGKHIVTWEKHNGKVPKGYVVIFADSNKRNFDIDNLILVSRAELLRLNQKGLIKNQAEYTKVGLNIVKLEAKIKERS